MSADPQYDVAISFASADEPLAAQLRDLLQPPHSVFLYSKAQEQLAGRDGIEAFRTVFREHASLVVILYSAPWGQTPWTRVEKTAIEELSLAEGWEHLMFVRLNDADPVPKWVPKPHLYLNLQTFGMSDLVGAIKARLIELGVESKPISPAARAAAQERLRAFNAETETLLTKPPWIFDDLANNLCDAIRAQADQVSKETKWKVACGPAAILGGFAVTAQGQGLTIRSGRKYLNSTDDTYLVLAEFDQALTIQQPGLSYTAWRVIKDVNIRKICIRRLPDVGWCWELDKRVLPVDATAAAIVHILLDRIEYRAKNPKPPGSIFDDD